MSKPKVKDKIIELSLNLVSTSWYNTKQPWNCQ